MRCALRAFFFSWLCACSVEGDRRGPSEVIAGADAGPMAPPAVAGPGAELVIEDDRMRLRLSFGEEVELKVRLMDDGVALDGLPVAFDLVGQAKDAALSRLADTTDADGYATTTLRAGQHVAAFKARATTPGAREVSFDVAISGAGFGTLNVVVQYEGERTIDDRFVRAYPEQRCDELLEVNDRDPATALVPGAQSAQLLALPAGVLYAVQAFGRGDAGSVIAEGCEDGMMVVADSTTDVVVTLLDEALVPAETLAIDLEVRAITGASAIGSALRTAAETLVQESVLNNTALGPEGTFWLDALDSALREGDEESVALADALASARLAAPSDGPDVELNRELDIHDEGVVAAMNVIADDVRDAMRDLTLEGTLSIDAEAGSARVALDAIACGAVVDDDEVLEVALEADEPSEAAITLVVGADAMQLDGVRFAPRLGALAAKALRRLLSEDVHGAELTDLAGCESLRLWLEDQTEVDASACGAACVAAACATGMARVQQTAQDALLALDEARPLAELSMTLALHDENGDLIAEEMSSEALMGEWKPAPEATLGDALTGSASARAEAQ